MVSPDQQISAALNLHRAGQLDQAERIYRQVLSQNPNHHGALHLIGVVELQKGNAAASVSMIERAIQIAPNIPDYHNNFGTALRAAGRLNESAASYQRALHLRGDLGEAWLGLGVTLRMLQQFAQAQNAFQNALKINATNADALLNLGLLHQECGDLTNAIACFKTASSHRPLDVDILNSLATALEQNGQWDQALEVLQRAIAINPSHPQALNNLGTVYQVQGKQDQAAEAFGAALRIVPAFPEALTNLAHVLSTQGQIERAVDCYQEALRIRPGNAAAHSDLIDTMQFSSRYDGASILRECRNWAAQHAQFPRIGELKNDRDPNRRLKVGMVSPDFLNHPVGRFLLPLFEHRDLQQIEFIGYSEVLKEDHLTQKLKSHSAAWRSTVGMNDESLARQIRDDQIDLLVDLSLHTARNRLLAFARRPAPVQLTYLAYPGTSGLDAMDYRLTDPYLDPPGNDAFYSEESIRLKSYWCYRPSEEAPSVGPVPAIKTGFVTFGCMAQFSRVSPEALAAWATILAAVPNSRFLMHAYEGDHRERTRQFFAQKGIEPSRIEFLGWQLLQGYFETYNRIDVLLDPFPYCGGTTTCDALWMGCGVVTLAGDIAVRRGGVTLLTLLGLDQWVANDAEAYCDKAIKLASNPALLEQIRRDRREQMRRSSLMDEIGFTRDIEARFREIWKRWCAGNGRASEEFSAGPQKSSYPDPAKSDNVLNPARLASVVLDNSNRMKFP